MAADARYRLVLADPLLPIERLAPLWAALHHVTPSDAAQKLRRSWGILDEAATADPLKSFGAAYAGAGILVRLIEPEHWPTLPAPQPLQKMPATPVAIEVIAACQFEEHGAPSAPAAPIGPSKLQRAASVGIFLATGMPIRIGPKKEKHPKPEAPGQPTTHLWLELLGGSPCTRFRINAREFDYSCLGVKKGYSSAMNARTLLKQWLEVSRHALMNDTARVIADGKLVTQRYGGLEDFEKELQWLWCLKETA